MNYQDIKFKVWDGERLTNVNSIGWTDGEIDWIDTPKYSGPIQEDMKIFQYTGLKDKNGVDIYTGDICEVKYLSSSYDSEFVTDIYEVSQVRYAFRFLRKNRAISLELDKAFEVRVIGNIYENRELLK